MRSHIRSVGAETASCAADLLAARRPTTACGARSRTADERRPHACRYLADIVASIPVGDKQEFKHLYENCTHDILCVLYLSSLVRSHIALAEKLATFALPLG